MRRYFKGLIALLFATYLGYSRYRISQVIAKSWFEKAFLHPSAFVYLVRPLADGRTSRYSRFKRFSHRSIRILQSHRTVQRRLSRIPQRCSSRWTLRESEYSTAQTTLHTVVTHSSLSTRVIHSTSGSLWLSARWADLFLRCPYVSSSYLHRTVDPAYILDGG